LSLRIAVYKTNDGVSEKELSCLHPNKNLEKFHSNQYSTSSVLLILNGHHPSSPGCAVPVECYALSTPISICPILGVRAYRAEARIGACMIIVLLQFDGRGQGWARAAARSAEAQGFGMRHSAEAQSFLDTPLRAAALRCSAGPEWRALQRGAAAARKEARSCSFFP
jgi:hypothetical protein